MSLLGRSNPSTNGSLKTEWPNKVAVKELSLSYYFGETILIIMYTHYGNLI